MKKPISLGEDFKKELKNNNAKYGLFLNAASPTIAEQLSHTYDWLLVDAQHGPMDNTTLAHMISAIGNGKALSLIRVSSSKDQNSIQTALDLGVNGILVPCVNNKAEALEAVRYSLYPPSGIRSIYFPQRSTNEHGLLDYLYNANKNTILAVQIETKDGIDNIDEILSIPEIDIAFLGQSDLSMSLGLFEKYKFPEMYTCTEMKEATQKMIDACKKHNKILGVFLFGSDRVQEYYDQGYRFISVGNDLHHVMTQATAHLKAVENFK